MRQSFAEKRQYWKKQITEWERSGESAKQWSASHGHNYQTFLYWKNRFHLALKQGDFVELSESKPSNILVRYQDMCIEIDEHFHAETLTRLLTVIKSALC